MRHGSRSPVVFISGLVSCIALMLLPFAASASASASALKRAVPVASVSKGMSTATWTPDNGNGTFTNPLFYDEFSDPDLIRVGNAFYLTGTTMHSMPGLPVLYSRDLVNWRFLSYASEQLDLGPAF